MENKVEVEPSGRLKLSYDPTNLEAHDRLTAKFRGLLDAMQCKEEVIDRSTYLGGRLGISSVAHQNGTARFGTDPASRPWTSTARCTTSTISTSSTRASSARVRP